MIAPEHLRGSFHWTYRNLHRERFEWVKARLEDGETVADIAAALDITRSGVWGILRKNGYTRISTKRTTALRKEGITLGWVRAPIDEMPHYARAKLADAAARTGKPMAEVLVDFWAQHHEAQA